MVPQRGVVTEARRHGGRSFSMRSPDPRWFPRFADIPGVSYQAPADLDLARLQRRHDRPNVHRYADMDPTLWWGDSSRAPAAGHVLEDPRKAATSRVLRTLAEALELPGEPSDYHFLIQNAVGVLWSRRDAEPALFADLERLCWLDLQLIEAFPDTIRYEHRDGDLQHFRVETFDRLLNLYMTEGSLADAARVLALADRHGNGEVPSARRARERCAAYAAEDAR
jgi:hypothetical protein